MSKKFLLIIIAILAIAMVAGCTPVAFATKSQTPMPTIQSTTTSADPIGVAKAYMEVANTGNFDKTLTFYADDAVVYNPLGVFVGKDEISKWLMNDVKTTRVKPSDIQMQGSMVVVTGSVSLDRFQKAGIEDVAFRADYMVENGKIRFFAPTVQLTSSQLSAMKSVQIVAVETPTPKVNPEDIARAYVDAANSGDFNKAISFYASDAAALVMNNTLLLSGKDQISSWLVNDVQTTRATPLNWQVNGNVVINTGTVSLARFAKLGINQVQYQSIYIVENGKIRLFWPTLILTPEQKAKIQAAQPAPTMTP